MSTYTVQSPVKSGGKIYQIGATIKLDDETAAPLLAIKHIAPLSEAKNLTVTAGNSGSDDSGDGVQQAPEPASPAGKSKGGKTSAQRGGK